MKPEQTLAWMHDGTRRLLGDVAGLPDEALGEPTALPGWNRRYLLAHIAANADALRNLVHWARTGEERRMYASTEQREADIAAGAKLPAAELRAWISSSARALAADLDELGDGPAWEATVITAQGLTRSASEIPWMRDREVWIHAVDLRAGTTFGDLPADFLDGAARRRDVPPLGHGRRPRARRRRHRHRPHLGGGGHRRPGPGQRTARRPGRLPDRPHWRGRLAAGTGAVGTGAALPAAPALPPWL